MENVNKKFIRNGLKFQNFKPLPELGRIIIEQKVIKEKLALPTKLIKSKIWILQGPFRDCLGSHGSTLLPRSITLQNTPCAQNDYPGSR